MTEQSKRTLPRRTCLRLAAAAGLAGLLGRTALAAPAAGGGKMIVVYYTWAGSSGDVAKEIERLTGCDVFLLEPAEPYPSEYQETVNRAVPERESDARPALKRLPDLSGYDTVVIGHPIWGGKMPMMFYTLLEDKGVQAALKGKTILHWATNGGSGLGDSQREITRLLPESRILPGLDLYGWGGLRSPGSIRPWLEQNGIAVRGS